MVNSVTAKVTAALAFLRTASASVWKSAKSHPANHWLAVAVLALLGTVVSNAMHSSPMWQPVRWKVYETVQQWTAMGDPPHSQSTVLVYLGDDEFWSTPLAHRLPLNRIYLAKLLARIAAANPHVIALDFAMLTGPRRRDDYSEESKQLVNVVHNLGRDTTLVVAAATHPLKGTHLFALESAILDNEPHAQRAFYEVNDDVSEIELQRETERDGLLDGFSVAIARVVDPFRTSRLLKRSSHRIPYSTLLPAAAFDSYSATDVLDHEDVCHLLAHKIVIVGGRWHTSPPAPDDASDPTDTDSNMVDLHRTPIGPMSGAVLQANYVDSLLGNGMKFSLSDRANDWLEIVLALLIGVALTLGSPMVRFWALPMTVVFLLLFTYVSWQLSGVFFDCLIPSLLLTVHAVADKKHWIPAIKHWGYSVVLLFLLVSTGLLAFRVHLPRRHYTPGGIPAAILMPPTTSMRLAPVVVAMVHHTIIPVSQGKRAIMRSPVAVLGAPVPAPQTLTSFEVPVITNPITEPTVIEAKLAAQAEAPVADLPGAVSRASESDPRIYGSYAGAYSPSQSLMVGVGQTTTCFTQFSVPVAMASIPETKPIMVSDSPLFTAESDPDDSAPDVPFMSMRPLASSSQLRNIEERLKDFDATRAWSPRVKGGAVRLAIPPGDPTPPISFHDQVKRGLAAVIAELRADPNLRVIIRAGLITSSATPGHLLEVKRIIEEGDVDDEHVVIDDKTAKLDKSEIVITIQPGSLR
jgi:CHASE2 domain-containing sensor protein